MQKVPATRFGEDEVPRQPAVLWTFSVEQSLPPAPGRARLLVDALLQALSNVCGDSDLGRVSPEHFIRSSEFEGNSAMGVLLPGDGFFTELMV